MELVIALVLGLTCLGIFLVGALMLLYYYRSGRADDYYYDDLDYGDLVQCAHCGYMNPRDAAACLNCHQPLPHAASHAADYAPQPSPAVQRPPSAAPTSPPPAADLPAPPPNVSAWMDGVGGPVQGQRFILKPEDTLVGRSTVCTVQVSDPKVSRRHFLIRFGNGAYFLQDQNSSRGTQINGQPVMAQRLYDGDRITIGDSRLVFRQRA